MGVSVCICVWRWGEPEGGVCRWRWCINNCRWKWRDTAFSQSLLEPPNQDNVKKLVRLGSWRNRTHIFWWDINKILCLSLSCSKREQRWLKRYSWCCWCWWPFAPPWRSLISQRRTYPNGARGFLRLSPEVCSSFYTKIHTDTVPIVDTALSII